MGKRGPKKTPTAILEQRGSWRAKTRGKEPETNPGWPDIPEFQYPEEIHIWHRTCRRLEKSGVLSESDQSVIEGYCVALCGDRRMRRILAEKGEIYDHKNKDGTITPRVRPEAKRADVYEKRLRKLEQKLGLDPSARAELAPIRHSNPNENRGKKRADDPERWFTHNAVG